MAWLLQAAWHEATDPGHGTEQNAAFELYRPPHARDQFLATMVQVVPWGALCSVMEPHYPEPGNGRPPVGLERTLRMYVAQHWFNLSDKACEDALLDSTALRRFVGFDLGIQRMPDATTLLKFRRLIGSNGLGLRCSPRSAGCCRPTAGNGTVVDATIIAAPSSIENAKTSATPRCTRRAKASSGTLA